LVIEEETLEKVQRIARRQLQRLQVEEDVLRRMLSQMTDIDAAATTKTRSAVQKKTKITDQKPKITDQKPKKKPKGAGNNTKTTSTARMTRARQKRQG